MAPHQGSPGKQRLMILHLAVACDVLLPGVDQGMLSVRLNIENLVQVDFVDARLVFLQKTARIGTVPFFQGKADLPAEPGIAQWLQQIIVHPGLISLQYIGEHRGQKDKAHPCILLPDPLRHRQAVHLPERYLQKNQVKLQHVIFQKFFTAAVAQKLHIGSGFQTVPLRKACQEAPHRRLRVADADYEHGCLLSSCLSGNCPLEPRTVLRRCQLRAARQAVQKGIPLPDKSSIRKEPRSVKKNGLVGLPDGIISFRFP